MTTTIALAESTVGGGASLTLTQIVLSIGAGFVVLAAILILERLEL
jgi:hypothetical protein